MNEDEAASVIHRMMRQLKKEDTSPSVVVAERHAELAPFQRRMTDGGLETLNYAGIAICRP